MTDLTKLIQVLLGGLLGCSNFLSQKQNHCGLQITIIVLKTSSLQLVINSKLK